MVAYVKVFRDRAMMDFVTVPVSKNENSGIAANAERPISCCGFSGLPNPTAVALLGLAKKAIADFCIGCRCGIASVPNTHKYILYNRQSDYNLDQDIERLEV
jgi:hypothetical protein